MVNLHQVDAALKYADRIIGICQGEIVYDGPTGGLSTDTIERIYRKPMDQLMIGGDLRGGGRLG